ncbi:MAG: site-specific DNA-methyltransferase [Rhodospirillales bacterium]|nr:site-specific DNA-methyltransferase [Rhodospirillales bacterium]
MKRADHRGQTDITTDQREEIIRLLRQGEDLSPEWARVLFPPEKREYELLYHGKEREEDIIADTLAVPLQKARCFGRSTSSDAWQNKLIFGDNLQAMKSLLQAKRSGELCNADGTPGVRLVYIDPPFATKQEFRGAQDEKAYQDKLVGAEFLEFIRKRLIFIRELLADDGVIFVHTDWKKNHYIRAILDEVFGEARFRNEIIWWYYNKMQGNVNRFPSNHETIYLYSRGNTFTFNTEYAEREGGVQRLLKRKWDSKTKRLVNARDAKGALIYIDTDERRIDDVWRLSMLQPADRTENQFYPTQKPETLLAMVIESASKPGDLVMDCFAGSGTTIAVAEKLDRRWIGIDCGKLSIYTIQKRMLSLRANIGNDGPKLAAKPFTLYNAGLYDFSQLKQLGWDAWRFFALQLFQCRDQPHKIGGMALDGYLKGSSVLVFRQTEPAVRIDEETIRSMHEALGSRIGGRMFIIAPALAFDFQQDYLVVNGVRYYALRIPYSIIHELHQREFTALKQPSDEMAVNDTVEAVGFDFIRVPELSYETGSNRLKGGGQKQGYIRIKKFRSEAVVRDTARKTGNRETLSMVLLDYDYAASDMFQFDAVVYAETLENAGWEIRVPAEAIGDRMMAIFIDIYGNEAREVIPATKFGLTKKGEPRRIGAPTTRREKLLT